MKEINLEKNSTVPENVPPDLTFVWTKYDPMTVREKFTKTYAQIEPKTAFQKELISNTERLETFKKEQLPELYGIEKESLEKTYAILEESAYKNGVTVEYAEMQDFSEDDNYGNDFEDERHEKHAETARSDGKTLLLEKNLESAGGQAARTYDLMHLAFGHMVQWSSEDKGMLLTRDEAWSIGYRNHEKSPDRVLDMMSLYEFEAGMMGLEAIRQALEKTDLSDTQKERMTQYFADYVYADRDFIIQHYRGNYNKFEKYWKFGQPIPPRQTLPEVKEFIARHAVEVGLIRDKQEK